MLLLAALLVGHAHAQECFTDNKFPKYFADDTNKWTGYTWSAAVCEATNTIYSGGRATTNPDKGFIYAVDVTVNRTKWRRFFSGSAMDTITAMAPSPDGATLAVHGSTYNNNLWSAESYIFTLNAADGGHINNMLVVRHGDDNAGEHWVRDSGITWSDSGSTVYLAFTSSSTNRRDNNAGKMLVGAYDPTSNTMQWVRENINFYGYSTAVAYKNFCAGCGNIYVGGASNDDGVNADGWHVAIQRFQETGDALPNQLYHMD